MIVCKYKNKIDEFNKDSICSQKIGEVVQVSKMEFDFVKEKEELLKILAMGLCIGQSCQLLLFSPLKKVCLLSVRGSTIAISCKLANKILVKKETSL